MGTSLWNKFYALLKRVAKLEFRTLTTHVSRVINSKKRLLFSVYASQQNYPKYPLSIWMTQDRQSWSIHVKSLHNLSPVV